AVGKRDLAAEPQSLLVRVDQDRAPGFVQARGHAGAGEPQTRQRDQARHAQHPPPAPVPGWLVRGGGLVSFCKGNCRTGVHAFTENGIGMIAAVKAFVIVGGLNRSFQPPVPHSPKWGRTPILKSAGTGDSLYASKCDNSQAAIAVQATSQQKG